MEVLVIVAVWIALCCLFVHVCTGNIREYNRKKRAQENGGEDYVSRAWTGRKNV